jgi:hypothetical protein
VGSKKTKEKAKDKKDRLQKKARNIIENDGYGPEENNYDTANQKGGKGKHKEQTGQFKTMDIRH